MPAAPPSCSLTPAELRRRRDDLLPGWIERADHVTDLPEGLRLTFSAREGLLPELAQVIEAEEICCSFLRFSVTVEPAGGPITFDVSGPSGTGRMLRGRRMN